LAGYTSKRYDAPRAGRAGGVGRASFFAVLDRHYHTRKQRDRMMFISSERNSDVSGMALGYYKLRPTLLAACLWISMPAASADIQSVQVPVVTGAQVQFFQPQGESQHFVVRRIVQDDKGFLWLGAADGLRRYDGYRFLRVPGDSEAPDISGFIISESLIKDRSGVLWFGVDDFLVGYDPGTGNVRRYRTAVGGPCGSTFVHQITEDREGFLWLATNESLIRLDPITSRLSCYQHRPNDPSTIATNTVIATIQSRDGTLWVATSGALDAFDRRTGTVTRRISFEAASGAHWSLSAFPANLYEDHSGMIWTGLSNDGDLASVDPKTGRIAVYSFRAPGSQKSAPSGVVSMIEDQDGALWLATNGLGLLKLDPDRKRAVWYESNPDDPSSLSGDLVVCLFQDREGSFWAFTKGGDVYRFDPRAPVFRAYRHQLSKANSLIDDSVISAYEDSHGILWVGTERGLNRINRKTGEVKRYESGVFASGVRSIAEDRHGYLWFGTRGNGLMRFDVRTGASRSHRYIESDPKSLSNDYIAALLVDPQGVLWSATDYGIDRYEDETGQFQRFSPSGKSLTRYHSIAEELGGPLWLASSEFGLDRFDPRTGEFTQYRHKPGDERSLSHNRVYSVYADHSGTIWAATFRGLDKFNPADHSFTHYDQRDGLPANTALGILEDERGYLWISTPDGLGRFDPRTLTCTNYHSADGLPSDLFSVLVTASKSRTGEMFFGSYNGLVAFFPNQVIERGSVPPVVVTGFRLFGETVQVGKGPLKKPIWSTASLGLPEGSIFSFEFSALSYTDPSRTRYRYRLEGLETKWNEGDSTRRVASYTALSPGNYTFRVQARTDRGDWNAEGVTLPIRILPLWYDTWLFRSVFAAAVVILLWTAYHFRIGQLGRLRQLEAELAHMHRVNMMGELTTSIAHEINQPLSGIVSNGSASLRWLAGDPPNVEEVREALRDIVRDGKRAGEIIARIRALTKRAAPPREKLDVNETIREVLALVGDEAKRKSVVIRTQFADDLSPVSGDRVQLQQVLLNLVMNGMEAMSSAGERQLVITTQNIDQERVQVTVQDSGTGLDRNTMGRIFEPFYTTKAGGMGMGLSISRSIVQNHGGRLWATANAGPGTSFHFTLPKYQGEEQNAGAARA